MDDATREVLYLALDLAQKAVRLDSELKLRDAYEAYWQSVFLIRQVMETMEEEACYESDSDSSSTNDSPAYSTTSRTEIERLAQIHDTYADRMALLASKLQPPSSTTGGVRAQLRIPICPSVSSY